MTKVSEQSKKQIESRLVADDTSFMIYPAAAILFYGVYCSFPFGLHRWSWRREEDSREY